MQKGQTDEALLEALDRYLIAEAANRKQRDLAAEKAVLEPRVTSALNAQRKDFGATVERHKTDIGAVLVSYFAVRSPADEKLEASLSAGAKHAVAAGEKGAAIDLSIESVPGARARAVDYLASRGADAVTEINATTKTELAHTLADGVAAELTDAQLATLVKSRFAEMVPSRAEAIVRTELSDAYEVGARALIDDLLGAGYSGIEKRSATEDNPCDVCIENEDDEWIPEDESFSSGDDEPTYHTNCECHLEWRIAVGGAPE